MQKRMVDFIRALRAAGVRISLAESQDAMYGVDHAGVGRAATFKSALKATLVKGPTAFAHIREFLPAVFSNSKPPLQNILEQLNEEQEALLQQAMQSLLGNLDALRELLQRLLEGQEFSDDELRQLGDASGLAQGDDMYMRPWFRAAHAAPGRLDSARPHARRLAGRTGGDRDERGSVGGIGATAARKYGRTIGADIATCRRLVGRADVAAGPRERPDLLDVPLHRLGGADLDDIREEVRRLAARLRTRAALRQKRAKSGRFDPRKTVRKNMRYGGVPLEVQFRARHKKPSLILICDIEHIHALRSRVSIDPGLRVERPGKAHT